MRHRLNCLKVSLDSGIKLAANTTGNENTRGKPASKPATTGHTITPNSLITLDVRFVFWVTPCRVHHGVLPCR